jgi:excinuclease ABC subunit C
MSEPEVPEPSGPDLPGQPASPDISLIGPDLIRDELKRLPNKPGVYRMFGEGGEVLYVGKAKNLKNRVGNYARIGGQTQRIALMIKLTRAMEFVVTETETEALLLESNLIKRLKPRFNIILRDDKSFPYILIRRDHQAPQLVKHRGAKTAKGDYFGPFASAYAVNETVDTLQKAFLLRTCEDSVYNARTRPCMLHQIKRCAAPCVDLVSEADYKSLADEARDFLRGKAVDLQARLSEQMQAASDAMEFERAARLRDRIRALATVRASQGINPMGTEEADVFALAFEGGQSCVQVFFFRAGQNWGNRAYYPRHDREDDPGDVLEAFIGQFYDDRPPPRLILTSDALPNVALLADALSLRSDYKVYVHTPQKGEKRDLVEAAIMNAREALSRKLAETGSQTRLLAAVGEAFGLDAPPRRIEVYDNSHIQGAHAVGAFIVAGPEGFAKNQYRKFNIPTDVVAGGDDFAMMREVMRRRFAKLAKAKASLPASVSREGPISDLPEEVALGDQALSPAPATEVETNDCHLPDHPDIVLIDGGLGQLHACFETLAEMGLSRDDVRLVSIAKGPDRDAGEERFFMAGREPFRLPKQSPVLYFLQRMRDEAHRFAIGAHRAKRSAAIGQNPLDEIDGIGPARKKALLHHFGSARGVSRAKLSDLERVEGVNAALARRIYDYFHGG